jgi:hypothetical protein
MVNELRKQMESLISDVAHNFLSLSLSSLYLLLSFVVISFDTRKILKKVLDYGNKI